MPTIDDLYKSYDAKNLSWSVEINLVALTAVEEISWDFRIGVVPTASIKVSGRAPAVARYLAPVHINAGFNGVTERQFTGIVLDVDRNDQGDTIRCVGGSWPLDVNYHEVVYTFDNVIANDALEDLFNDAGLTHHYVVDAPAWTICAVSPVTHEWETYGEAVTSIGEVDGCRWYEFPSGTVRIGVQDPIPGATSWRTYFTGHLLPGYAMTWPTGTSLLADGYPRIRYVSAQSRVRDCKNRARVKGQVIDTAGGHGTTDPVDITATAYAASPWVRNPDGSQAYNDILFSSDLIDTDVKAGEVATRLVVANNRLLQNVDVEIDGDPQIRLARTVRIIDPDYSGINSRWYVDGYSSRITAEDYATVLYLIGGAEAGSEVMIDPFALFTYVVEREVIGDREYALVTFDSTPSYDPDGTIVSRAWSDSLGLVAGSATIVNVRVDPALAGAWTVTLTVTDNAGLTSTLTLPIDVGAATNPNVFIPSLFLAFGTYASASPDGGTTWNDKALAGCISAAAKAADGVHYGIGLFGTSGGEIYRTTDYCATAPTLVVDAGVTGGQPINHIWWDLNHPTAVWAITQNGGVFLSWDDGVTWAYYDDLAARFGLAGIRLQRIGTPVGGGVWIFGGTGTGYPLIAWDAALDHNWVGATLGGELAADLADLAHADIYVAAAAARQYPELGIILNSATHTPAVYYASNVFDGSTWKRATGATGTSRGRWMDIDQEVGKFALGFDTKDNYLGDVAGGVMAVSPAAASLDVGDAANHGLWLGWWVNGKAGAYLVAAEATGTTAGTVYKTWDRFGNIGKVRPATGFTAPPAGAKAKMIAIGAPGASYGVARIAIVQDQGGATTWDISFPDAGFTSWLTTALPSTVTHERPRPKCLTSQLWFVENVGGFPDPTAKSGGSECNRELSRTPDGGVTWGTTAVGDETCTSDRSQTGDEINHFSRVAMDASGRIWAARKRGSTTAHPIRSEIWYSDSQGANGTWVYSATLTYPSGGRHPRMLLCHPSNQNIIALISSSKYAPSGGDRGVIVYMTENRGGIWTQRNATVASGSNFAMTDNGQSCRYMMLPSGRLVIVNRYGTGSWFTIHTSDDKGATWQLRFTNSGTPTEDNVCLFGPGWWKGAGATVVGLRVPVQGGDHTDWAVITSPDSGTSWAVRSLTGPSGWESNNWDAVYDEISDTIYAQDGDASGTGRRIWALQQATNGGTTWEDKTGDMIGPAYIYYPHNQHWEGIALIPR